MSYHLNKVFPSRSALEGYVKCLQNIKVGDKVFIYLEPYGKAYRITDSLLECEAIGLANRKPYRVNAVPNLSYPPMILGYNGSNSAGIGAKSGWSRYIQDVIEQSGDHYKGYSTLHYVLVGKIIKST